MVTFENVTAKNALIFAMKEYDNPQCLNLNEFVEDYKRFKYVKRLCRRYAATGNISERLMLNHLVLLINVFGADAAVRILFLKCGEPKLYKALKPFLLYMGILSPVIRGINGADIYTDGIPLDKGLLQRLQEL